MPAATTAKDLDLIAPGSRVIVRDLEWQVVEKEAQALGTKTIVGCVGRSELVRDQPAAFFSDLDEIKPEDPKRTTSASTPRRTASRRGSFWSRSSAETSRPSRP